MKTYNKLVRDKIPSNIKAKGEPLKFRSAKNSEKPTLINKKLLEEAAEVTKAENRDRLTAEIADLQDIINLIKRRNKIREWEVKQKQRDKFEKNGGYGKMYILEES
jgi:predicted house-cleaning noncanonical NTP pyrophosphatase (MazG superfamily)